MAIYLWNKFITNNNVFYDISQDLVNLGFSSDYKVIKQDTNKNYSGKGQEKVKENDYDVILMDIMMPEMDGVTALKELRKIEDITVPVIAVTADAIAGSEEKYLEEGFTDYISKPFTKDQIEEKLRKILGKNNVEIL